MRNMFIAIILLLIAVVLPICSVQAENAADAEDETVQLDDPFYIASISDRIFKRIYGKSFKEAYQKLGYTEAKRDEAFVYYVKSV